MVYFKDPHFWTKMWTFFVYFDISLITSKLVEYMSGNHLVVLFYDGFMLRMIPQLRLRAEIAHFLDWILEDFLIFFSCFWSSFCL